MKITVRKISNRIGLAAAAFVLVVSSLTAMAPFMLSKEASAVSSVNTVSVLESTDNSITLRFNIASTEIPGFTGIFETQVDNGPVTEYSFEVGVTDAPFTGVNSFVQVREQIVTEDFEEPWTDWQKFYVQTPVENQAPVITINGATTAKSYYGKVAGTPEVVRIQVSDDNYAYTVIERKNSQGEYAEHFVYTAAKGPSFKIEWLQDGPYRVYAVDMAGVESKRLSFTLDRTDPHTTFVAPAADSLMGAKFTLSGSASDNISLNRVYVQLVNRSTNQRMAGNTVYLNGTSYDWSYTIDAIAQDLPDGIYAAHVAVVDNAGNTTSQGWSPNFKLDRTAPVASIEGVTDGETVNGVVEIDGVVVDEHPMNTYFTITGPDGYKKVYSGKGEGLSIHSINWDTVGLKDGTYTIKFETRDGANNKNEASTVVISVIVDNTDPLVTINPISSSTTTPTITGTVSENDADVVVTIDGNEYDDVKYGDKTWTYVVKTALSEGWHDISVVARDAAGNVSQAAVTQVRISAATFIREEGERLEPLVEQDFPAPVSPVVAQQVLGTSDLNDDTLNNAADLPRGEAETKGAATQNVAQAANSDENKGFFMGLAWYWWILIVAGAVLLAWWIIAAVRGRNAEA